MKQEKEKIVFGRNPVVEAIESGKTIDRVYIRSSLKGDFEIYIRKKCEELNIPLKRVPEDKLNKVAPNKVNHQGIIAAISPIRYAEIQDQIDQAYSLGITPLIVILDGITDVRNFGAIVRSAEIFGATALVIPLYNSATISSEAVKTSAGALFHLPICRVVSTHNLVETLKLNGFKIVASSLESTHDLKEIDFSGPIAVIIGSEDEGVSPHLLRSADENFKIKQTGKTESLNASVATGIVLYEIQRQRN